MCVNLFWKINFWSEPAKSCSAKSRCSKRCSVWAAFKITWSIWCSRESSEWCESFAKRIEKVRSDTDHNVKKTLSLAWQQVKSLPSSTSLSSFDAQKVDKNSFSVQNRHTGSSTLDCNVIDSPDFFFFFFYHIITHRQLWILIILFFYFNSIKAPLPLIEHSIF